MNLAWVQVPGMGLGAAVACGACKPRLLHRGQGLARTTGVGACDGCGCSLAVQPPRGEALADLAACLLSADYAASGANDPGLSRTFRRDAARAHYETTRALYLLAPHLGEAPPSVEAAREAAQAPACDTCAAEPGEECNPDADRDDPDGFDYATMTHADRGVGDPHRAEVA